MKNEIVDLSKKFALEIIEFTASLKDKKQFEIANQLLRSGTSIGANIWEAQSAQSRADFIHKLKISDKEAHETEYWLILCEESKLLPNPTSSLKSGLTSIKKLLNKIISTAKKNK